LGQGQKWYAANRTTIGKIEKSRLFAALFYKIKRPDLDNLAFCRINEFWWIVASSLPWSSVPGSSLLIIWTATLKISHIFLKSFYSSLINPQSNFHRNKFPV
jgi:hypothetical protein